MGYEEYFKKDSNKFDDNNLDNIIRKDKYSKYFNSPNSRDIESTINLYSTMRLAKEIFLNKAGQVDDPKKFMGLVNDYAQRFGSFSVNDDIREALGAYVSRQMTLGLAFAAANDWQSATEHFSRLGLTITTSNGNIGPAIDEKTYEDIMERAIHNLNFGSLLEKLAASADKGDTKNARIYGSVANMRVAEEDMSTPKERSDAHKLVDSLVLRSYSVAMKTSFNAAFLSAIVEQPEKAMKEIEKSRKYVSGLLKECLKIFYKGTDIGRFDMQQRFTENVVEHAYDILEDVASERLHPVRQFVAAFNGRFYRSPSGKEMIARQESCIPIVVHPFYARTAASYGIR